MLGRILRFSSILIIVLATVFTVWLINIGVPPWVAVLLGLLLPPVVHAFPLGVEFLVGAVIDRRPIARLGPADAVRVWLTESWRSFLVFNVDQPWRCTFPERAIIAEAARPTVLLIHGYMCNRGAWRHWLLYGLPQAWNIATINLEPAFASIDEYAACIDKAVAQLRADSGADRVTLVCHSMGGLAARAYLRRHGQDAVQRVITIDTPHHGTIFARFAHGANTQQMRRDCDFVRRLADDAEPVDFVCFAGQHDNLIVPRDSQLLGCAESIWFEKIGHLAMIANPNVLATLIQVVERPAASTTHAQPDVDATKIQTGFAAAQG